LEQLRSLQLQRLQATVRHAYANVALFRLRLDEKGLRPEDIRSLADIALLPFMTKTDLRDTYPTGLFAVPMRDVVRLHASSGTTGKPIVVGYTQDDLGVWQSCVMRSLACGGVHAGDILHNAYGYGLFTGGLGLHYGAERLGLTVVPVSGGMTARQVMLIDDFRPALIAATPSYMLAMLDEFRRQGRDPRATSLAVGLFGAEPWTNAMRAEIEDAFDMHAIDLYGLSEIVGPGVACECVETKDGPHLWEDHFYPEIVDPATGAVLGDGQFGELVLTTLTKEALPMVRYRTRDLTRLRPGTARPMRRIEKITGRSDDMIILRGVNLFPSQIEEMILKCPGLAPHFEIELTRTGRLDDMTVHVECTPAMSDTEARAGAAETLARNIKHGVGVTSRIEVRDPGAIARSEGKARRVVDNRPA